MPIAFMIAGRSDAAVGAAGLTRRTVVTWLVLLFIFGVVGILQQAVFPYWPLGHRHHDMRYSMDQQRVSHNASILVQLRNMMARSYSFTWFFSMLTTFRTILHFVTTLGLPHGAFTAASCAAYLLPRHRLTSQLFGSKELLWHINQLKFTPRKQNVYHPGAQEGDVPALFAWFRLKEFGSAGAFLSPGSRWQHCGASAFVIPCFLFPSPHHFSHATSRTPLLARHFSHATSRM